MGSTLRYPNFEILSLRYIKVAQKTKGAKILAFIETLLVSRQIFPTATARDRRTSIQRMGCPLGNNHHDHVQYVFLLITLRIHKYCVN
jgi:hypothetical protein